MIILNKYRNSDGRINLNAAEVDLIIKADKEPYKEGTRPKKWFLSCNDDQQIILFKETWKDNYEDIAEIVGYEIARTLGLFCTEYDFAICDGKQGVISKNFIKEGESFIKGGEILNFVSSFYILPIIDSVSDYQKIISENISLDESINLLLEIYGNCPIKSVKIDNYISNINKDINKVVLKNYLDNFFEELSIMYEYDFSDWSDKKSVNVSNNLMDIWSLLENYCRLNGYSYNKDTNIMNELIKMFFYDIIVNQCDRHIKGNWGILLNKNTKEIRLAPIYDNSNICGLHNNKKKIKQRYQQIVNFEKLVREQNPRKYEAAKSQIESLSNKIQPKLMIDYDDAINNTEKFDMLKKLIIISDDDTYDLIKNLFEKIKNIKVNVDGIEEKYNFIIPIEAKTVLLKILEINIEKIKEIIEERERKLNGRKK